MTGWPGTPAATSTCHPSRAPAASISPPRTSPASPPRWPSSTGRWSGSVPCWDCAGPRLLAYGWDGSTFRPGDSPWPRRWCAGPVGATCSARPSRRRDDGPCSCRASSSPCSTTPRAGRARRSRRRCARVHRRRGWLVALLQLAAPGLGARRHRSRLRGAGFHDLRRLNATTLVVEGIDVKTAQTRLGHADPRVTLAIYASAPASVDRAAADVLGERFFGSNGNG